MVNPGNELRRKRAEAGSGAVLASATPSGDAARLESAFLGPETYANGSPVQEGDVIGLSGKNYREQYRKLREARPELANVVYGHAIEANGRLWLQYWLWYFYNDYQLSFGAGNGTRVTGRWSSFGWTTRTAIPTSPSTRSTATPSCARGRRSSAISPATSGRSSMSRAARTRLISNPASTRPRRGTTSPTASGA